MYVCIYIYIFSLSCLTYSQINISPSPYAASGASIYRIPHKININNSGVRRRTNINLAIG